ncbi:hypothetical protein KGQ20_45360 [Catenulispora sp. NF23]|uniref:YcxB-like protein domain-containing protein n=1 Tax=Catenulispora pinistramenti TaxID=2705254 RepID=A0ABS5L759_9ACTN|nr:hypothetical protein [Catenulispora pinistramenti]MBS2539995.1 hypothetical protein [Catenulispora pinistramenti]MBS2553979.1 hypothetical protein [Catenulispora pinistramenti]
MGDLGGVPDGVADADEAVVVAFFSNARFAVVTELGDALATVVWIGIVVAAGLTEAFRDATVILPTVSVLLVSALLAGRYHRLRVSGRLRPAAVTVAFDAEGVTYAVSGKIAKLPWNQWRRAYRRFGIWHLKLAAAPSKGLAFPDSALEPEQRVRLVDVLEDKDLLRNGRRY